MMTPEQFYSESKWPEMKDKFDKTALIFNQRDLCEFANDYAQQELQAYRDIIKELIPIASKARGLEFPGDEFVKAVQTIERAKKSTL